MTERSKRLLVLKRIHNVLSKIQAGENYYFTPGGVSFRFQHWSEVSKFPFYSVSVASGGTMEATATGKPEIEYQEDFYCSVKIIVRGDDTVSALERAIHDVRTAILTDARSTEPGSLGDLTLLVEMDEPPLTDDGYLSLEGYGFADLRVKFRILNYF